MENEVKRNGEAYDIKLANEKRQKELENMIANGQLGCMTEVAYGFTIADRENPKGKKEEPENK